MSIEPPPPVLDAAEKKRRMETPPEKIEALVDQFDRLKVKHLEVEHIVVTKSAQVRFLKLSS
jgi:hypothetical protein